MKKTTISLLVSGLFAAAPAALAQMQVTGSVSATVLSTDLKTEKNAFRFDEYRDLESGATIGADIRGEGKDYFLRFFGENLGRDDQFMELKGGRYGVFKYSLYNNDIIHNLTHNAISPYTGIGSNNLSFAGALGSTPSTDTATWTTFDYKVKHQNYGGTFEWQSSANSPFYFRATANEKETKGMRPIGGPGTSPGGPTYELPLPVSYTTSDVSAEAGYATKASQFSVNMSWSRFQDHNDYLFWRNPFITNAASTTTGERTTIAADNKMWKIGANAIWKQLPMGSTLALRGTYSKLTNDLPVQLTGTAVSGSTGQIVNTNPDSNTFKGDVVNKSFSASLTSQWTRSLDSRVYWNWTKKENRSTEIVFTPVNATTGLATQTCDINPQTGIATGPTCSNELFHYKKDNFGVDLQFRMNPQNRISGGWDYVDTERERIDFEKTKDNKWYLEWRNSSLDSVTAKVKYQRLNRRADFLLGGVNPAANANSFFNFYLKRFDLNDNDQDLLKVVVDMTPREFVDLGAELIFKDNKYKNVVLGRTKDTREELYLTASFGDPQKFRVTTFFDYERTQYDSTHWVGAPDAATFPTAVSGTRYLWNGKVKDKNHVLGVAADWPFSERLKFKGSITWQDTDGTVDMASNTALAPLQNITSPPGYDSFRRNTLNLQGIYSINKNFDVSFGYAHEKFRYNDIQMDGYNYTLLTGTTQNFFGGAYAFQNYSANIVYATLKYNLR